MNHNHIRVALSAVWLFGAQTGCRVATPSQRVSAPPPGDTAPATGMSVATGTAPAILSAHLGVVDAPPLGKLDGLPVVFSGDVDAASLEARAFSVMFSDGSRVRPVEARLAPANEGDENRTVLLIGDFGDPTSKPPTDVMVVGRLFGETGQSFEGLVAKVEGFEAPGRVVFAERLPAREGTCQGSVQAVRTYWMDGVRDVQTEDLADIDIRLQDGTTVKPVGFDDQNLDDQSRDDNVLDLCVGQTSPAIRVTIAAGLFTDPPGHRSDAVEVDVAAGAPLPMASASAGQ